MYKYLLWGLLAGTWLLASEPRARDLGIAFDGKPGDLNAITDVPGIQVGHTTLIEGEGALQVGKGPVRTGVTAILPKGKSAQSVPAAWYTLNGNGEMTGTTWIEESGLHEGPIIFTNTYSVGIARDAVRSWANQHFPTKDGDDPISLPVVGETWDGRLNDINGMHVKKEHVFQAIDNAKTGKIEEGNVGGGTGMVTFGYKSGIGTSSRVVTIGKTRYVLGTIVQSNFGTREEFLIQGKKIQTLLKDALPKLDLEPKKNGSILIAIATDAPLLAHQLKRIAKRAGLGLARVGGIAHDSSGDLFIAFSTHSPQKKKSLLQFEALPNDSMDELFRATVESVEESVLNSLVAAKTMVGINGNRVEAVSRDKLQSLFKK